MNKTIWQKLNIDIISLFSLLKISYFYRLQVNTYTGVSLKKHFNTEAGVELTLTLTLTPEMNSLNVWLSFFKYLHFTN